MIKIEYDGKYPNTCSGTLSIYNDDIMIYQKKYCCHSTGSVYFDSDWDEHVESGKLVWDQEDAHMFSKEIQNKVKEFLSQFHVCCGGCI